MKPRVRASFVAAGGLVLATALGDDLADHLGATDRAYTELMKLPAWRPASRIVITVDKGESRMRTPMRAVLAAFLLALCAATVQAQTQPTINPTKVIFTPSPDHNGTNVDGTPIVSSYDVSWIASNVAGAVAFTKGIGKPAPDSTGVISVTIPEFATLTPNQIFTATVTAKGSGGASAPSQPSNPFARQVLAAPRPVPGPAKVSQ